MPTLRVPVEISWNGSGSPGVNIWHMRSDSVPGTANQTAIDELRSFYATCVQPSGGGAGVMAGGWKANLGQVVDVATDETEEFDWEELAANASAGDAPPIAQVVVSWRTSIAAARGHGRTFLGPLASAAVQSDGTPIPSFLTDVRAAAAALVAFSTGNSGASWGIYGYESKGGPGRVIRDITGYKVRDQFASLRSRRD